ncbi:MAG TPA: hypothetical protein VER58_13190 [Thermoanaerobaculia bacterium]|nr:hypothetical protein [Thermoanaerobaculia bacterium]
MQILMAAMLMATCAGTPSKEHPGYKSQVGSMLPAIDARELGIEFLCKGSEGLILLQALESRTPDGLPVWKALAEKKIRILKGETFLTTGACTVKGSEDPEVLPFGQYGKKGEPIITRAFRANRAKESIDVLDPATVKCAAVEGED